MNKELIDFLSTQAQAIIAAPSSYKDLKAAAQAFLDAADKDAAAKALVAEAEADITTIDGFIAFASSPVGEQVLGPGAAAAAEDAKKLKANGVKWCPCPACQACAAILEKKAEI